MNDRETISQQLSAYLDGELTPAEAAHVEAALQTDSTLAKELADLKKGREMLLHMEREKAPDDFAMRVLAQAERLHLVQQVPMVDRAARSLRWIRYSAAAAVAVVAMLVGVSIGVSLYTASKYKQSMAGGSPTPASADAPTELAAKPTGPTVSPTESLPKDLSSTEDGYREKRGGWDHGVMSKGGSARGKGSVTKGTIVRGGKMAGTNKDGFDESGRGYSDVTSTVVLLTDKLPEAQVELEKTLVSNGALLLEDNADLGMKVQANASAAQQRGFANVMANNFSRARNDDEIVYDVHLTEDQAVQVQRAVEDLGRRGGQNLFRSQDQALPAGQAAQDQSKQQELPTGSGRVSKAKVAASEQPVAADAPAPSAAAKAVDETSEGIGSFGVLGGHAATAPASMPVAHDLYARSAPGRGLGTQAVIAKRAPSTQESLKSEERAGEVVTYQREDLSKEMSQPAKRDAGDQLQGVQQPQQQRANNKPVNTQRMVIRLQYSPVPNNDREVNASGGLMETQQQTTPASRTTDSQR